MTGDENLKQAAIDVLSQLGYNVILEEKPKMPDPFLKKGDEFWYITEYPLQVIGATVVEVGWYENNWEILEVKFEVEVDVNPTSFGKKVTTSFLIESKEMDVFYFRSPVVALKRALKLLDDNNQKQGELHK